MKGADPWLEYHDGNYYLVTTTFTGVLGMRKSPTLAGLATAPNVQIWSDTTPTRNSNIWAPEIHFSDGHWYLYYSAGQSGTPCCGEEGTQRTHVLESAGTDPMGPYTYKSMITGANLYPTNWLIDASVLRVNGRMYMVGSGRTNSRTPPSLVIASMSNPYTVSENWTVISTPTLDWETRGAPVNEGPEPLQHDGRTFLIRAAAIPPTTRWVSWN